LFTQKKQRENKSENMSSSNDMEVDDACLMEGLILFQGDTIDDEQRSDTIDDDQLSDNSDDVHVDSDIGQEGDDNGHFASNYEQNLEVN
jgi:hypothetical protein